MIVVMAQTSLSSTGSAPAGRVSPVGPVGPATPSNPPIQVTPSRPGLLLGLILVGQFMALLDVAIVNVAAPGIGAELHASGSSLQLVISGYTISYAVLLITGA